MANELIVQPKNEIVVYQPDATMRQLVQNLHGFKIASAHFKKI